MKLAFMVIVGYLVGSINPAYLIAKFKGFDIRERGSKNAGASNVVILMGKKTGFITALLDIFKAYLCVKLTDHWLGDISYAAMLVGVACVLGHIFPITMGFRGGKGLACLGGLILAFDYRVFGILLLAELILVLIVDYICIVPITASIVFPLIYKAMTDDSWGTMILSAMALVIVYKHWENIKRIRNGAEAHFSFLWRRDKEVERLRDTVEDEPKEEKDEQ